LTTQSGVLQKQDESNRDNRKERLTTPTPHAFPFEGISHGNSITSTLHNGLIYRFVEKDIRKKLHLQVKRGVNLSQIFKMKSVFASTARISTTAVNS